MAKRGVPEDQTPRERSASLEHHGGKGWPGRREFLRIKKAQPHLDAHEIWQKVGYGPVERAREACEAPWADGRASPAPARIRNDPRPD